MILNDHNDFIPKDDISCSSWVEWIDFIWKSANGIANKSEDGNINACYNSEFAKQVKTRLLSYIPIWTGLMRPYFQNSTEIATSSAVEAKFNDLKNRGCKGNLPMRVDKFIMLHLNYLDAKIILASHAGDIVQKHSSSKYNKNANNDTHYEKKSVNKSNTDEDADSTHKVFSLK